MNTALQLSGEGQPTEGATYSLDQYIGSNGGVTERLLGDLDLADIVSRAQAVQGEADRLADAITQPSQGPS
ncbi:hypothetical protein C8A05DRAFT_34426 [Staphylotrichum tortipilum]|uniref:Uncharacterized protein n=1 Tax=Staphylotrichum tortipilum TaxID=2831512 RepID=A0AAN6MJ78_9PEZI|nr:hypothetical protein C8A05DRAFT_34426 [Staphylotrichum longicolle]